MDKTDFMNIMQLTMSDVRVVEPDAVGIVLMALHRNSEGYLEVQFGSNVDVGLVMEALAVLATEKPAHHRHKRKTT